MHDGIRHKYKYQYISDICRRSHVLKLNVPHDQHSGTCALYSDDHNPSHDTCSCEIFQSSESITS